MLNVAGIVEDSIVDGPGIRTVVFAQGCPHGCVGCHNPETWSSKDNILIEEEALFEMIKKNRLCRGVTFSGGEPFAQAKGFFKLAKLLKEAGYEVASFSGYTFEELQDGTEEQKELLQQIDILIDGRYEEKERTLELTFRGSKNQRIIDVLRSLEEGRVIETTSSRWVGDSR